MPAEQSDALLEAVKRALEPEATTESRAAGAQACRTLLAALGAGEGEPLVAAPLPSTPVATAARQLAAAPPGAVLDAVIARLQALVPDDTPAAAPAPAPLRIPFVPIPKPTGENQ